jgi:glycosyltransferase involved in cell wall biosynthesis
MKLAIVHPSLAVKGGAENVVIWLAGELARRGHTVTVFTSAYDEAHFGPRAAHQFLIITQDLGPSEIDPVKFILAGWRLRKSLAGFDWVNPHNFPAYHWVYWARRFNPRIGPLVWFCEEPMRWFYPEVCNPHLLAMRSRTPSPPPPPPRLPLGARLRGWLNAWKWNTARRMDLRVVPRLNRILANSEFIAGEVRTIFHVPAEACLLGAPPARLTTGTNRGSPRVVGPYLLTVSRLHAEKNIETVLQAIRVLKEQGGLPFARYVVAGDGPLRATLAQRVHDLGIADVVQFLGFVSDDDLADLYRHAALVIYVPLDETYGLVFPEAAFWRKAVIGPDHGGPAEIVRHGETGLQVDATDPQAIANAIATCLRDSDLRERLGNAAYKYAMAELTFPHFVDRFERLLGNPPAAARQPEAGQDPPTRRHVNTAAPRR